MDGMSAKSRKQEINSEERMAEYAIQNLKKTAADLINKQ